MKIQRIVLGIVLGVFLSFSIQHAQAHSRQDTPIRLPAPDDPFAARLDSLDVLNFFKMSGIGSDRQTIHLGKIPADSVPRFSQETYRARLKKMDALTPFDMRFHEDVLAYIEMYAVRKRGAVSRMLGMAQLYFPLFEEKLAKNKMPLELKYLAVIESALHPNARSKAGAMGLWQFMYGTGKLMGLEINSYIDERCDPVKATEAACKYLSYLYKLYGDWALALAAYNAGPGNVNKAIRRSGGKSTYWELRPFLPKETSGYVPVFIAANYVLSHAVEHNLQAIPPKYFWYEVDSVIIKRKLSFSQISALLGIAIEDLKVLNPAFIMEVIPESEQGHPLFLPKKLIGDFINNEESVYALLENPFPRVEENTENPEGIEGMSERKTIIHPVVRGEGIFSLARKYEVAADSIKVWNNLPDETLRLGQELKVYVTNEIAQAMVSPRPTPAPQPPASTSITTRYHTVRSGETLWAIAKKYGMSIEQLKKANGLRSDNISSGTKLKVK
jgi:membrane-bound lytic murein transglycosylase D